VNLAGNRDYNHGAIFPPFHISRRLDLTEMSTEIIRLNEGFNHVTIFSKDESFCRKFGKSIQSKLKKR